MPDAMPDDWSSEETDDQYADRRNFYKVEKWSKDGMRVIELLFAGANLDKSRRIFARSDLVCSPSEEQKAGKE